MIRGKRGFSLIELMFAMAILVVISGSVFQIIHLTLQRSRSEQIKTDMFQGARQFVDQMSRDLRQAGYPNPRNLSAAVLTQNPAANDLHAATGLTRVGATDLWFEADVDGVGVVSVIRYHMDTSEDDGCPCLKRSQLPKVNGNPLSGQTPEDFQLEVQGVLNTDIFRAFSDGVAVPMPVSFNAPGIAAIDAIQVVLTTHGSAVDPATRVRPLTTLTSTIRLNNCSQAASGSLLSCD